MIYLRKLPLQEYRIDNNEWIQFRDIFIRLRLVDDLMNNPSFLTTMALNAGERADVVAHRLYGNSNLYWTLYLVNDIIDPSDWIVPDSILESVIKREYSEPGSTAYHIDQNGNKSDPRANRWMVERKPFGTENIQPVETFPVSHYQDSEYNNEGRRIIRAIRKEFINDFLIDAERKIRGYYGE